MNFKKTAVRVLSAFVVMKRPRHALREFLLNDDFSYLNAKGKIRLFYCISNFGDILNCDMMRWFGHDVVKTPVSFADMCCIGSLLDYCLSKYEGDWNRRPLHVFGTGFMKEAATQTEQFCRPLHVYALRGKLSKNRCEKILNSSLDHIALGDPGLLIKKMFPQVKKREKYDVGIIPHYEDQGASLLENIRLNRLSWKIINVKDKPDDFIRQVAECSLIISSSLHGLVCADSLGIPNKPMILSDKVIGGGYKFLDYYSVFQSAVYNPVDLRMKEIHDEDIKRFKDEYAVTEQEVEFICEALVRVFDSMHAAVRSSLKP